MKDKFIPQKDTSYSAGLAYLITQPTLELILVLQQGGERNQQKQGPDFVERRAWKIPMGHFDPAKDFNLLDTATREFQEETGLGVNLNETSIQGDMSRRIPSERPGYSFHEDNLFNERSIVSRRDREEKRCEHRKGYSFSPYHSPHFYSCRRCVPCSGASQEACRIILKLPIVFKGA